MSVRPAVRLSVADLLAPPPIVHRTSWFDPTTQTQWHEYVLLEEPRVIVRIDLSVRVGGSR